MRRVLIRKELGQGDPFLEVSAEASARLSAWRLDVKFRCTMEFFTWSLCAVPINFATMRLDSMEIGGPYLINVDQALKSALSRNCGSWPHFMLRCLYQLINGLS